MMGGSGADGSWGVGTGGSAAAGILARRGSRQAEQLSSTGGAVTSWKDRGIGKERERERDRTTTTVEDAGGGGTGGGG